MSQFFISVIVVSSILTLGGLMFLLPIAIYEHKFTTSKLLFVYCIASMLAISSVIVAAVYFILIK